MTQRKKMRLMAAMLSISILASLTGTALANEPVPEDTSVAVVEQEPIVTQWKGASSEADEDGDVELYATTPQGLLAICNAIRISEPGELLDGASETFTFVMTGTGRYAGKDYILTVEAPQGTQYSPSGTPVTLISALAADGTAITVANGGRYGVGTYSITAQLTPEQSAAWNVNYNSSNTATSAEFELDRTGTKFAAGATLQIILSVKRYVSLEVTYLDEDGTLLSTDTVVGEEPTPGTNASFSFTAAPAPQAPQGMRFLGWTLVGAVGQSLFAPEDEANLSLPLVNGKVAVELKAVWAELAPDPTPTPTPDNSEAPEPAPTPVESADPTPVATPAPTPDSGDNAVPTPTPDGGEDPVPTAAPGGDEPIAPTPTPDSSEDPAPTPTPDNGEPAPTPTPGNGASGSDGSGSGDSGSSGGGASGGSAGGSSGGGASGGDVSGGSTGAPTEDLTDPDTPLAAGPDRFVDVGETDWFYAAVEDIVSRGLLQGTSETTFQPQMLTTRGMIATILYRLEGEPQQGAQSFPDVSEGRWYTDAVAWAAANEVVKGYDNGNYGPDDPITREQLALILYRYAAFKGCDMSALGDISSFVDAQQVSSYAVTAVEWAVAQDVITGKEGARLDPQGVATRAEVAAVFSRYLAGTGN